MGPSGRMPVKIELEERERLRLVEKFGESYTH
uniref:Uncharacterized protein n=1 Tax=Arundo donax TaxID=35708 RepID=A0A0A9BQL7_ARUDO